jgi:hypothetical protein
MYRSLCRPRSLIAGLFISLVIGSAILWWTRPFVLTGSYPNGTRAWEQWERRTLTMKYRRIKTVRYYRNGQRSYVDDRGRKAYFSPDGRTVSVDEWIKSFSKEALHDVEVKEDQSQRPMQPFVDWLNRQSAICKE